ncbi:predicted protein [Scheffersomyces stipitis CBS 6054]|uniref:K Homology domain-containing protein n=1 Tax=Scheffersomyces stipitis (strain ATCC 58785 / CBS 6054 / NBRC 10063 / NRRL Y-11545) TaxID=322104 RepID=A3LZ14_PICST|nr:predicted protein [Scheffersomyces stipitis CBS 6054]ABN68076.2 predicted protein [Scheffersomyces stipitis CBS 6054]
MGMDSIYMTSEESMDVTVPISFEFPLQSRYIYRVSVADCGETAQEPGNEDRNLDNVPRMVISEKLLQNCLVEVVQYFALEELAIVDGETVHLDNKMLLVCEKCVVSQSWVIDMIGDPSIIEHVTMMVFTASLSQDRLIEVEADFWCRYSLARYCRKSHTEYFGCKMRHTFEEIYDDTGFIVELLKHKRSCKEIVVKCEDFNTLMVPEPSSSLEMNTEQGIPELVELQNNVEENKENLNAEIKENYENKVNSPLQHSQYRSSMITATVHLKQREVSSLIGVNGTRLNTIREQTGCKIKVQPVGNGGNRGIARKDTPQQITVSGHNANVQEAIDEIRSFIVRYRSGDFSFM